MEERVNVSYTRGNGNFSAAVNVNIFHHAQEEEGLLFKYYPNADLC